MHFICESYENLCVVITVITRFISSLGTSVEWAYNLIRTPPYFASKADLWRYAVMYTYGGMYLDDDSDIRTPLDEVDYKSNYTPRLHIYLMTIIFSNLI